MILLCTKDGLTELRLLGLWTLHTTVTLYKTLFRSMLFNYLEETRLSGIASNRAGLKFSKKWLEYHNAESMESSKWPPDLSIVETVLDHVVCSKYDEGMLCEHGQFLPTAIIASWISLWLQYSRTVYHALSFCFISVVDKGSSSQVLKALV